MTFALIAGDTRVEYDTADKAIMAYCRKVLGGRPCVLLDEGGLPDVPTVEIASYEGRPLPESRWNLRADPAGYRAAHAFALGAITELGALDPLTENDAHDFGMDHQHLPVSTLPSSWATWAAVRRARRNEAAFG